MAQDRHIRFFLCFFTKKINTSKLRSLIQRQTGSWSKRHSKSEVISPQAPRDRNISSVWNFKTSYLLNKRKVGVLRKKKKNYKFKNRKKYLSGEYEEEGRSMQIINSENTTCMETSQENVFRSCCQIKNGSSSNLVLLIISFIFSLMLSTHLLGKKNGLLHVTAAFLFLLHSQYCRRMGHLSLHWYKTVLYTENNTNRNNYSYWYSGKRDEEQNIN